jgi:mRNA-degrading endonuclease toxin of MazEF toxin-antitoxin module
VAKRGDVLIAKRKLGFAAEGVPQHFVVVQSDQLRDLDTLLVVPLDAAAPMYEADPLVVPVTAKEASARVPHVALVHLLTAALRERFEEAPAGRLSAGSMDKVDDLLAFTLQLTP